MIRDRGMMTPAELAEARESARIYAEDRKRDRDWERLVARNAAQGIYQHRTDRDDPWSEVEWSPCPPWCTKHRSAS